MRYERGVGGPPAHGIPSGQLAHLWTDTAPLVSLAAASGESRASFPLYACWGGMACAIDVETGLCRWASGRAEGDVAELMEAVEIGDDAPQAQVQRQGLASARGGADEGRKGGYRSATLAKT